MRWATRDRELLLERVGPRVTAVAQDARGQLRNRELALERLRAKIERGLHVPRTRARRAADAALARAPLAGKRVGRAAQGGASAASPRRRTDAGAAMRPITRTSFQNSAPAPPITTMHSAIASTFAASTSSSAKTSTIATISASNASTAR